MDTRALEKIIPIVLGCHIDNMTSSKFTGVFPIDALSKANLFAPGKLRVCVINSQSSWQSGEHWLVVGVDLRSRQSKDHHAFVFDSLALNLKRSYPLLFEFLRSHSSTLNHILRNKTKFQTVGLDSCGLHAIYFIEQLISQNLSFEEAIKTFHPGNTLLNDCSLLVRINNFLSCNSKQELLDQINKQLLETRLKCGNF